MGATHFEIEKLNTLFKIYRIESVIELGAQQQYSMINYGRYFSEWYKERGIQDYISADLNGENNSWVIDLTIPLKMPFEYQLDLVTDFGTSEHVSDFALRYDLAKFSWEAIYNCWKNKFNLCKMEGLIFSVNPKTGHWPGHGVTYYTLEFYTQLVKISGLKLIDLGEVPAMGNTETGMNIYSILRKDNDGFPSVEEFKTLDLRPA